MTTHLLMLALCVASLMGGAELLAGMTYPQAVLYMAENWLRPFNMKDFADLSRHYLDGLPGKRICPPMSSSTFTDSYYWPGRK